VRILRDQRDPQALGEIYLRLRQKYPNNSVSDLINEMNLNECQDYDAVHMGPLEKYGDPRVLPSTLPN
jgi:hypothetical protein